jgi:hypothetical protein
MRAPQVLAAVVGWAVALASVTGLPPHNPNWAALMIPAILVRVLLLDVRVLYQLTLSFEFVFLLGNQLSLVYALFALFLTPSGMVEGGSTRHPCLSLMLGTVEPGGKDTAGGRGG